MIKLYCLNKKAQMSGEHEIHTSDCLYVPSAENRIILGYFANSEDAMREARKHYYNVDGCWFCCHESHKK